MEPGGPIRFILNREDISTSWPPGSVVLDFLRRERRLTGTKEGCREGDCGACMILLGRWDGQRVRYRGVNSCLLPLGDVAGAHVVTIEGLNGQELNPIQKAMVEEGAVQCGFCTPGMIISLTGFFLNAPRPDAKEAVAALDGNICRCTGYPSIKRALERVCRECVPPAGREERIAWLAVSRVVPDYFLEIPARLERLQGEAGAVRGPAPRGSRIVSGGTDLMLQKGEEIRDHREDLFFLSTREDLRGIRLEGNCCRIGAATTVEEMRKSDILRNILPGIDAHLRLFGSTPIRERATPGGNIVNASPIGDLAILFLALDAAVGLRNGDRRRELPLKDFFKGYKELDKAPNELVEWVRFPVPAKNALFNFEKVSRRTHLDIASVNSAMLLELQGDVIRKVHLSAGGVAPVPLYLSGTVEFLRGKSLDARVMGDAAAAAQSEISPISDTRGSADYKRLLLRQLVFAHFITLVPHLAATGGPDEIF